MYPNNFKYLFSSYLYNLSPQSKTAWIYLIKERFVPIGKLKDNFSFSVKKFQLKKKIWWLHFK